MGVISQANASEIYLRNETTWGTAPTTTYNTLRVTNFRMRQRTDTVISNIISSTREPGDVIRVDLGAEGSFDFEMDLRYGTMGSGTIGPANLLSSLFANAIVGGIGNASAAIDVTTVVAGDTCHWKGSGVDFVSVFVGDWLNATGFALPANDGWYYVSAKTDNTDITVKNPNAVAETTATAMTSVSSRYTFGSTLTSFSIEQKVPTAVPLYHQYLGMVMGGMTMNIAPGSLITGTMNWLGKSAAQSTTRLSAITPIAPATVQILNSIDHISAVYEGRSGLVETWKIANLTLNMANDFAPRSAIGQGSAGAIGIRLGRANVTGTMRIYVEHASAETGGVKDIMDSYLAGTSRAESTTIPGGLAIVLKDNGSPVIYHTMMLHEYFITDASIAVGGNNEDLFLDVSFSAQVHPSTTISSAVGPVAFSYHMSA